MTSRRVAPHRAGLRWWMVAMCFLATVISYVDRQALSVSAPLVMADLGLTSLQYSQLVTAFLGAYTVGQLLTGRLVDRLGTRLGFTVCIVWWSVAAMGHAAAGTFASLALARFLLGLGEAGSWPASMRTVAEWFPLRERARAVGLFGSGTAVGAVLSPPLVAWLTLAYGWRAGFVITGALGLVWTIGWLRLYAPPEAHPQVEAHERAMILAERAPVPRERQGFAPLLGTRAVWGVMLGRALVDPVWWFYVFWLPPYLSRERQFDLAAIGGLAWIPFLTAGLGNLAGGALSDVLVRRGRPWLRARLVVLAIGAAGTLFGVPAALVPNAPACLALISAATFCIGLWTATAMTLNADVAPGAVGRMTGLSGTASGVGGILFTLVTGWIVDRHSYTAVFALAGVLPLIGFTALRWLVGPGAASRTMTEERLPKETKD